MPLPPGMFGYTIPEVWGPVKYPIKKLQDGTYHVEGYGSKFQGSPREIAEQILLNLSHRPESGPRKNFTGPFSIQFKPEVRIIFCMTADPEPKDLDVMSLAEEITKEFKSLSVLLPFS